MAKSRRRKKNKKRNQIKNNNSAVNTTVLSIIETVAVGTCSPRHRPRVRLGSNIEVIPKSCIIQQRYHLAVHGTTAHKLQPSPIVLEKVGEINFPHKLYKRNRGSNDKPFVPRSCITGLVSSVGNYNHQSVSLKDNLTPPITGRFASAKRPQPGRNIVIVPSCCIIPPAINNPPTPSPAYDWRKIFPEPIKLSHVPHIIGPRLRFRTKKYTSPAAIFVPPGCIITPEQSSTQQGGNTLETVVAAVADQAALAQAAPSAENNQFNIIAASAVVLFAIFLLLLLTQ